MQRLSVLLRLRWTPQSGNPAPEHEAVIFSTALQTQVVSLFGLTQPQALVAGMIGLLAGGSLSAAALIVHPRRKQMQLSISPPPNTRLVIELPGGLSITPTENLLLQTIFHRYARLVIEREFLSGYSGARTFLAQPIRSDGRSDAYTIAKLGESQAIQREFINYETFVKDTLPRSRRASNIRQSRPPARHGQRKHLARAPALLQKLSLRCGIPLSENPAPCPPVCARR